MEGQDRLPNAFLQTVLEEIVKEEGLVNTRIKVESGSSKGDNYVSVIYRVKVNGQRASDQGSELESDALTFIFKCLPENKIRRKEMNLHTYFNNEAKFYNKVLPGYVSFLRERGAGVENTLCCTAKCYRALTTETITDVEGAEEVLVMEDMREQGYILRDRRFGLDVSHCQLVLEELAKLHALSFAIRDQKPEQFNNLKNSISETLYVNPPVKGVKDYIAHCQPQVEEALMTRIPGASVYKQRVCDFMQNYYDNMLKCVDGTAAEPYAVICHGDCWTNNFLFKYSKNDSKPTRVTFLDFQLTRYSSPVLDLSYFITCCTDEALRCEHYNFLLTRYYDTLAHFIRQLGSDPEKLFPHDVFKEQLKQYSKFGFGMAVITLPLFTTAADNIPDLDEIYKEGYKAEEDIKKWSVNSNSLYHERMSGVIIDMVDFGYI